MSVISPRTGPVYITGRSFARQMRNGTEAQRGQLLADLQSGKVVLIELTRPQTEQVAVVSLVVVAQRRPVDEKKRQARLDRRADKVVEQLGVDTIWRAVDRKTQPELPLTMMAAAE